MIILTRILNFLKQAFSKKYLPITMGVIILILILLNLKTCGNLSKEQLNHQRDNKIYENNIYAMNDTLKTKYDKDLDRMVTEKTSFLVKSVDDLKLYNEEMYNEFKNVKNMVAGIKSDVRVILPALNDAIGNINQDPADSNKFSMPWEFKFSDPGLTQNLIGKSNFGLNNCKPYFINSNLDSNSFNIKLRYAITEDADKYTVKAFSPSPLVTFTEMDGALSIDKIVPEATKSNRFSFGPTIGIGLNTDITGKDSRIGWTIGVGATYNIFGKTNGKKGIKNFIKKTVN